ncbi:uncharacterized protein RAG0_10922 [Rhynchosporium agropyri]|uniref:Uncharacterized protein n=1 Tax=Rhynchosporium agropyri TaxID=914238 RepID=A0A1E1L1V7_9HELO|nr:uncharacterized protein RAG0_10922 [Rhynchosporium agropyri]
MQTSKETLQTKQTRKASISPEADTKVMSPPAIPPPTPFGPSSSSTHTRPFSPSITGQSQIRDKIITQQPGKRDHSLGEIESQPQSNPEPPSQPQNQEQYQAEIQPGLDVQRDGSKEIERPPFEPFFMLIDDLSNGKQSTHHPSRVHYIFADDDVSEVFTGCVGRAVEWQMQSGGREEGDVIEQTEGEEDEDSKEDGEEEEEGTKGIETGTNSSSDAPRPSHPALNTNPRSRNFQKRNTSQRTGTEDREPKSKIKGREKEKVNPLKSGPPTREERVLIIDINSTGDAVTKISSLSPQWQVVSAEISKAPMWDKEGGEDGESPAGLGAGMMLRVEGVGLDLDGHGELEGRGEDGGGKGKGKEREGESVMGEEEMQLLMEGFDRKMGILRRVVQRGSREDLGPVSIPTTVSIPGPVDGNTDTADKPGD